MQDCDKFIEKFLAEIPYLDSEADKYVNGCLIELIKTADEEVRRLFFASMPGDGGEIQDIRVPQLSVLCVSNILAVCNNPSISGRFKTACVEQIDRWLELNSSETGQTIFKSFLDEKLKISECTCECITALYNKLIQPSFSAVMQILAKTKTPVQAQLIVSAMKAIDSQYGELLIQKWLLATPKEYKDFEWWDSFQQIQIYPWFHGVDSDILCSAIEADVNKVLQNNVKGIQDWLDSVKGPDKYGLLKFG